MGATSVIGLTGMGMEANFDVAFAGLLGLCIGPCGLGERFLAGAFSLPIGTSVSVLAFAERERSATVAPEDAKISAAAMITIEFLAGRNTPIECEHT